MGKGGVSGTIDFPEYIKAIHEDWMTGGVNAPYNVGVDTIMANSMDEETVFSNSGTNLFDNFDPTSPASTLNAVDTRYATLDTAVGKLTPKGDWCEYIKEAVAKVDECVSKDIDSVAIVTKSLVDATSLIDKFFKELQTDHGIVPIDDYNSYTAAAVAKADVAGVLNSINFTTVKSGQISDIKTILDAAKVEKGGHGITEATDWEGWVDTAVTEADLSGVLKTIDIAAILTSARGGADSEVTDAITAAQAAAVGSILTSMKNAYETRQESTVANQVRRFMGSMVDSNSIHGSSFVTGLALLYNDHQRDVADFHTQITRDAFIEGIRLHLQAYLGQLSEEVRADIVEKGNRDSFIVEGVKRKTELQERRINWEIGLIGIGVNIYNSMISAGLSVEQANKVARDQFVLRGIDSMNRILSISAGYEQQILQLFALTFARHAEIHLRSLMGNKASRDSFVGQGTEIMAQMLAQQIQSEEITTRLLTEISRLRIVTTREFEAWEFDVAKRRATWNLDVYTIGGAMLGAPAGMSAVLPKEPSAAASVLSGALGGAAIGSLIPIPGVSTVVGAGLGAVLGGLGGAL